MARPLPLREASSRNATTLQHKHTPPSRPLYIPSSPPLPLWCGLPRYERPPPSLSRYERRPPVTGPRSNTSTLLQADPYIYPAPLLHPFMVRPPPLREASPVTRGLPRHERPHPVFHRSSRKQSDISEEYIVCYVIQPLGSNPAFHRSSCKQNVISEKCIVCYIIHVSQRPVSSAYNA